MNKKYLRVVLIQFIAIIIVAFQSNAQEDKKGCVDHALLSRIQDYYISDCSVSEYESYNFYDSKRNKYPIEGKLWKIVYEIKKGIEPPGEANVRKNYVNAVKKIGGLF